MAKKETPKEETQVVKKPTLKQKISDLVDNNALDTDQDRNDLKKSILELVQRSLYPDQFCPDCDDRLFSKGNQQECLNCGFSRELNDVQIQPVQQQNNQASQPKQQAKKGVVPKQVEEIIKQTESSTRAAVPSAKGDRIRELANKIGDVSVAPTPMDTDRLKGADSNVRDVNWV